MATYSFLSGSTVDNISRTFLDMVSSGKSYIGFSRGTSDNQWGTLALINVEAQLYNAAPSALVHQFTNTASAVLATSNAQAAAVPGIMVDKKSGVSAPGVSADAFIVASGIDPIPITIIEANESWLLVSSSSTAMGNYYYETLNNTNTPNGIYVYKSGSATADTPRFRVLKKSNNFTPMYTLDCKLWAHTTSGEMQVSSSNFNLQKNITMLGETFITGLKDFSSAPSGDSEYFLKSKTNVSDPNTYFYLTDLLDTPIIDHMQWVETNSAETYTKITSVGGGSEMFMTFAVSSVNGFTQYLKISVGVPQIGEYAIWNERLPFDYVVPNSDSNPPALEVSYLKTPMIERSIFDVNGLYQIPVSAVSYVKEMLTTADYNVYNTVAMQNAGISVKSITLSGDLSYHIGSVATSAVTGNQLIFSSHNFVVGDTLIIPLDPVNNVNGPTTSYVVTATNFTTTIDVSGTFNLATYIPVGFTIKSLASNVNAVINYAYTKEMITALRYGLSNVMVEIDVPVSGANIYDGLYRQLFVSWSPATSAGNICTDSSYNVTNYNPLTHVSDIGTLLYVSNRVPIYRKYINKTSEHFTLIL